jgi:H+/Cl- antiporter ClcA
MFGLVAQAKAVKQRATSLVQLNLELAKLEGKQKATALGIAAGLGLLTAVLVLYAIGFLFAAAAVGLAEALPLWLSLLIVMAVILLLAALSGWLAVRFARKAAPPEPSQAIEEAERTAEMLQSRV